MSQASSAAAYYEKKDNHALVISMLHHPYNWHEPMNRREIRAHLEETSDIIITGHEHDVVQYVRTGVLGEVNQYIEGGVLQDNYDDTKSSFNAILVDLETRQQKFYSFVWSGDKYIESRISSDEWQELQVNRLLSREEFELSDSFRLWLNDPGASFSHPRKGELTLDDIFIVPSIVETGSDISSYEEVDDEDIIDAFLEHKRVIVLGTDISGKTCFAKWLFRQLHSRGFVPVVVSADMFVKPDLDRVSRDIWKIVENQYRRDALESFKQLPRSRRVVIIDDLHKNELNARGKAALLESLKQRFDYIIVTGNELAQQIRQLMGETEDSKVLAGFKQWKIREFGLEKREQLLQKWLLAGDTYTYDPADLALKANRAHRAINALVGESFMPAHPIFMLTILQMQESGDSVNTTASTYGYYYEQLIRNALGASQKGVNVGTKFAYLSFIAYRMFENGISVIGYDEFDAFHQDYNNAYKLRLPVRDTLEELVHTKNFDLNGDSISFHYPYYYYFFVANYMKDHLEDGEVLKKIDGLAGEVYVEQNANILLFLAHLSKHSYIINSLLDTARKIFGDTPPATLTKENVSFLEDMADQARELVYIERDTLVSRIEAMRKTDRAIQVAREDMPEQARIESGSSDNTSADSVDTLNPLFRVNVAMKTLQILGQILKRDPGAIKGDVKFDVAFECYMLGLRTLQTIFSQVEENVDEIVDFVVDMYLNSKVGDLDVDEVISRLDSFDLADRTRKTLYFLVQSIAHGIVSRIGQSVGNEMLAETYRDIVSSEAGSPAVSLVDASIKLDHTAKFPGREVEALAEELQDNFFSLGILRFMIMNHFQLFYVDYDTKQKVGDRLGIKIESARTLNPRMKKLKN